MPHRSTLPLTSPLDTMAGNLLRALRLGCALTREQVAARVQIAPQTLRSYEEGTVSVPLAHLYELAPILGVTVSEFLCRLDSLTPWD